MPNWCSNLVEVDGDPSDVQAYLDFISPNPNCDEFDFEKIIPIPKTLIQKSSLRCPTSDEVSDVCCMLCGFGSSYDFCCAKWGTKWNANDPCINRSSGSVYFDTAWSPPEPVICKLSKMFPKLSFTLKAFEGGCCICGVVTYQNGSVISFNYPDPDTKEYYELMFEVAGGEDEYVFDPAKNTYVLKDEEN